MYALLCAARPGYVGRGVPVTYVGHHVQVNTSTGTVIRRKNGQMPAYSPTSGNYAGYLSWILDRTVRGDAEGI
ncbi:hypothetical protein NCAST_30_00240 [Nocardia asteroides NBRC 15531]|uniref:Uncharacterized protein n=1 Tax=Nocardia asteroides NBRC 15531 TaxID=1110697 RepID=U5EJF5_NOCAS|nr:hypothetical protein NCAST_30_00240 [Nocardia asteroides NBRC 15531]